MFGFHFQMERADSCTFKGHLFNMQKGLLFPFYIRYFSDYRFLQEIGYQSLFQFFRDSKMMKIMQRLKYEQVHIWLSLNISESPHLQQPLPKWQWKCTKSKSGLFYVFFLLLPCFVYFLFHSFFHEQFEIICHFLNFLFCSRFPHFSYSVGHLL